ncbi:MAG: CCA tRNA nucleotidyltransferase [Candidatus Diapherotrites archaeon]|uniref:CCA-adding enzyme n=1 Tax=Candidatus Iainarchaeum sp. TaxID=3101447 RepID=A0A8T4L8Y2_9ARCH|nr:CCA tRNA nucleotidyltransferase [Candidatus Diapherotrites archaeon]
MKKLLQTVLARITPAKEELASEKKIIAELLAKIRKIEGKHVRVAVYGSVGRQTQLANDKDIDLFVLFPKKLSRDEFESEGLRIAKTALKGHPWQEAYSEHPYIKSEYKGYEIEIIPAYAVKHTGEKKSAVDRTPFHHSYLEKKMNQKQKSEVRLLKRFLKGIGCYGADVKNQAFSGYATELLIVKYGSFEKTIRNVSQWKPPIVIDLTKYWKTEELKKKFPLDTLILIDPTDKDRNVTAAVSSQQIERFVRATGAFLKKPRIEFFFPNEPRPFTATELQREIRKQHVTGIAMGYPTGTHYDIFWGQWKRVHHRIENELTKNGFEIKKTAVYSNETDSSTMLFSLKTLELPSTEWRIGPPVTDTVHVQRFLLAHKKEIKRKKEQNHRIAIEIPRKIKKTETLFKTQLNTIKTEEKDAVKTAAKNAKILSEKTILLKYANNKDFRVFATQFLRKKEPWEN